MVGDENGLVAAWAVPSRAAQRGAGRDPHCRRLWVSSVRRWWSTGLLWSHLGPPSPSTWRARWSSCASCACFGTKPWPAARIGAACTRSPTASVVWCRSYSWTRSPTPSSGSACTASASCVDAAGLWGGVGLVCGCGGARRGREKERKTIRVY